MSIRLAAAALWLLTPELTGQCLVVSGSPVTLMPTSSYPAEDEGVSAPLPLGFLFPIGGTNYSHVVIESNGVAYLTTGGPVIWSSFGVASMGGSAGDPPRIAPLWTDLADHWQGHGIYLDTSVQNRCAITWQNVRHFNGLVPFTLQAVLSAGGGVELTLSPGLTLPGFAATTGVSAGNGLIGSSVDLSTGPSSPTPILYEDFQGPIAIDLANQTTVFTPAGAGLAASTQCQGAAPADHAPYGLGCYREPAAFYELFPVAQIDLSGLGMSLLPNGDYSEIWPVLTTYVPPPATATQLALFDDDQATVTLASPFPYQGGAVTSLVVCSNGFVSTAPGNGTNPQPTAYELLNAAAPCWRAAWHDFDPSSPGSGAVKFHQSGGIAYVTWDGVYSWQTTVPQTVQIQFDLTSGAVHVHWVTVTGHGNGWLVGHAPAGPALDPGNLDLSTALPLQFRRPRTDLRPLQLTAAPAPISTATAGSTVTYTTTDLPELAAGLRVGLTMFALNQLPAPGLDLGSLGAPGCAGLLANLDVAVAMLGAGSSQSVMLPIPAGVPPGTMVYVQSAALFPPGSLPNGQNPFGLLTSNGIATRISLQ